MAAATPRLSEFDFAFLSTLNDDFGDLPQTYNTTLEGRSERAAPQRIGHADLSFGTAPGVEANAVPSASASSDTNEDGITPVSPATWANGATVGVQAAVTGSGYLVGWIDFNNDGDFGDTGEVVASQAVTAGVHSFNFSVPAGSVARPGRTCTRASGCSATYRRSRRSPSPAVPWAARSKTIAGLWARQSLNPNAD